MVLRFSFFLVKLAYMTADLLVELETVLYKSFHFFFKWRFLF